MSNIKMTVHCCTCGESQEIEVDSVGYEKWMKGTLIQLALPKTDKFTRDALVTRMCFDCLSKTFNMPKPGEDWGESIGTCECCDATLWKKDVEDGIATCPCCYNKQEVKEGA